MKITKTLFQTTLLTAAMLAASQAGAAAKFSPEVQPLGYIGPLELSNTDLSGGSAKAYRGWYENGSWMGDLIEYSVSDSGALSTSIDLTQPIPRQGGTANWSANVYFADNEGGNANWNSGRKIITSTNGTNQVAFRWNNLTGAQQKLVDSVAESKGNNSSDILDFLRGDRSNEKPSGNLRLRFSVMGDVIHSNPVYVAAPTGTFTESSYVTFQNAYSGRAPRVYVGANDGMLHAFNANNGREMWAYVPSMLMHKLSRLAGTPYAHTYYVDGGLNVRDAYVNGSWKSVLAGSMGAGAKGMFLLNVTEPSMTSENLSTGANSKIMLELSDSDKDMGYIFGQTSIVKLNDGKWYAINGNGVSSENGVSKLMLISLDTGNVTKISTNSGTKDSPNGLSAPALVDTNGDGMSDFAYAGDIDGNMWKFDLSSSNSGNWKLDYNLYNGKATQPITVRPDVTKHPKFGYLVLFGTGRLYTDEDIKDTSVQALYGIWDTGSSPSGSEKRLARLLSNDLDYSDGGYDEEVRTFGTVNKIDYLVYEGWMVELPKGERLLTTPQLRAGRLKTTITDPDGYQNWLLEVTFDEGSADKDSIFDLNRSGTLDTADRVDANTDGDLNDQEDIPMGWKRDDGNMSQVTIARLGDGIDTLFLNFLNPPVVPPACSGVCEGGLSGGHMDVDTDGQFDNGLFGKTNGHEHEYDDKYNRTYVDYFDLVSTKLTNVEHVTGGKRIVPDNEPFIVLMTNSDWSPGGVLTINKTTYSVVEYQRIIHKALSKWDGVSPLLDPNGNSLINTVAGIKGSGGELKNTFDNQAIVAGGLIGTNTGCVNKSANITKGRYRNGSLVFQLVKASHFAGGGQALDRVTVQDPDDFKEVVVLSSGVQVELTEDFNNNGVIEGGAPHYEVFGGLVAKADAEFLYESTLFWHWDGDCYGDAGWEEEFIEQTEGVTEEAYEEMLTQEGYASFEELATEVAALEDCIDNASKKEAKKCKKELKKIQELYDMGLLVEMRKGGGSGGPGGGGAGSGGGIGGDPQVMSGKADNLGITKGLNDNLGRRTWIDIMPE